MAMSMICSRRIFITLDIVVPNSVNCTVFNLNTVQFFSWKINMHPMEEPFTMTTNKTPRIAIIGAGPGGLTLARILQTRNIPTTVFERESHPDERPQGGTL